MTPRTLAAAALCLAVGAGGGFAGGRLSADSSTTDDSTTRRTTENIAVERRSLAVNETTTGELAASSTTELTTIGSGTITTASTIGATVDRGGVLARVDDRPVVVMIGDEPVWRAFTADMTDGTDVEQLEANLDALGFDPGDIDGTFDSDTESAIEDWEDSLEISDPDGTVDAGQIIFVKAPVQVTDATAAGTRLSAGDTVATVRSIDGSGLSLTFTVAEDAERYQPGQPVTIVTTDAAAHPATILTFTRAASGGQGGGGSSSASYTVTAVPADATNLAPGPVSVEIPTELATDVLAVPSRALVAVLEGGQAVQLASGDYVAVEVGVFADGWVEVSGEGLKEGAKVVVPT